MRDRIFFAATTLLLLGAACGGTSAGPDGSLSVATSVYPLTFLVEEIGGGRVDAVDLAAPGVEPHDLELSTGQVADLVDADLVVYVGEGFQPAVEDALDAAGDVPAVDVLEISETIEAEEHSDEEDEAHSDEEDEHGTVDPHVWLRPANMISIAEELAARLGELDPDNASAFEKNLKGLTSRLEALDDAYAEGLADCERHEIVVSHEAFGYLTDAYGLEQVGISGLDPDVEPSPARLAEVQRFAEEHDVTTIFFEELASPAAAEALAREVGVDIAELNPLETEPDQGDYLDKMNGNLEALRDALNCT